MSTSRLIIAPISEHEAYVKRISASVHPADFWAHSEPNPDMQTIKQLRAFARKRPVAEKSIAILCLRDASPDVQNALLKITEEPPASFEFIALTDAPSHILPTLRSRMMQEGGGGDQDTESWSTEMLKQLNMNDGRERKISRLLLSRQILFKSNGVQVPLQKEAVESLRRNS